MRSRILLLIVVSICCNIAVAQGPYAPQAGQPGTMAMHKDSSAFVGWATQCEVVRGPMNINDPGAGNASAGTAVDGTLQAGANGVVSLGDGGMATLQFDGVIQNGSGPDFAVFENGFTSFLELGFVEVSSDGTNFFRFPATSLTDTTTQVGGFGSVDPTNLNHLAGKYITNYGVPFDLEVLVGLAGLDVNGVTHVRIVDVVGSVDDGYATYDAQGHAVNDPWPTPFPTGGFDLDAVGVIHFQSIGVDEATAVPEFYHYPNPVKERLFIQMESNLPFTAQLYDVSGREVLKQHFSDSNAALDMTQFDNAIYLLRLSTDAGSSVRKVIKR